MKTHYNQSFDIIIIGAGFTGCALAYQFSKAKAKTLLLESSVPCSGTSAACAGRVQVIESETKKYLEIVKEGFEKIPALQQELSIDLEWETPGHLTLLFSEKDLFFYEKKVAQLHSLGLDAEIVDCTTLQILEPYIHLSNCIGAVRSVEGHINPFNFCFGYLNAAHQHGATILTHQQVIGFETKSQKITAVHTQNNVFFGKTIILATGAWTSQLGSLLQIDIPIHYTKAEALVSEPIGKVLNHHIGTTGFYKSVHGDEKRVTLGVGQHRNGSLIISNAITPTKQIERASSAWGLPSISHEFKKLFPNLGSLNVLRTWSAPSPFAKDFLPVVGWLPQFENVYLAAAFHLAIPTIPLFSEKITKHILDIENNVEEKFLEPYSPSRFFR
jgi:sarcosine oxidase subunit beta